MTIQQLFIKANQELKQVVEQIKDDQWDISLPEGLSSKPATLKEAINYHIYDDAWVPDVLAGKTKEEVGDKYNDLLTTADTKTEYTKYNQRAIEAVETFENLDKTVHLSYGDFKAREYLQHITIFRSLRFYDIGKLIGMSPKFDPEFALGLLKEYEPLADSYRQFGILPAKLEAPVEADAEAKFLALTGRE